MHSTQTLHDFVLSLLTDPDARSAFELDPEGTLRAAGLGDLTPADIQDVVPLVVDYAPAQGATGLDGLDGLGLDQVVGEPTGLPGQLPTAEQVAVTAGPTSADVNVATLGAITVNAAGFGVGESLFSGIGVGVGAPGVGADTSGAYDVADTLDAEVLDPVGTDAVGAVGDPAGAVGSPVGAADGLVSGPAADGLFGTADNALNTVTGTVGNATGLVDSLDVGGPAAGSGLDAGGVTGLPGTAVGDLDSTGVDSGVTGGVDATLDGAGVGRVTGELGLSGDSQGAAAGDSGPLGLTDGLL